MNLTQFDIMLIEMINYLRYNNLHFNKVLVNFAINQDKKRQKETSAYLKKQTEIILRNTGAQIQNNNLYDALYVISIAKADFFGSSITTDNALAKFVKDYLDDENDYDGIAFNRFLSDYTRKGVVIKWDKMI